MKSPKHFVHILKKEFRKNSYFKKLFYSYLFISCTLFIIFTTAITISSDRKYKNDMLSMSENTLTQAMNVNDNILGNIYSLGLLNLMNNSDITPLLYNDTFNVTDAIKAEKLTTELKQYNSCIESIYFINFQTGYILTETNRISLQTFYDTDILDYLKNHEPSSSPYLYLPRYAVQNTGGSSYESIPVWSLIYHLSYKGAIVININYEAYNKLLTVKSNISSMNNLITNKYGKILTASDPSLFGTNIQDSPLYQKVKEQTRNKGTFRYTDKNDVKYYVTYIRQGSLGLTYISSLKHSFLDTNNNLLISIFVYSVLLLAAAFITSIILTFFTYRPVNRLKESLSPYLPENQTNQDEFAQLSDLYKHMAQKNQSLEKYMDAYKKERENSLLRKLIDPKSISKNYRAEEYTELFTYFNDLHYRIILISIDSISDIFHQSEDMGLLKYSITNVIDELAEGKINKKHIDYTANQIVYIFNFSEAAKETVDSILKQLKDIMINFFHIQISIAISSDITDTDDLPLALGEAKNALSHRFALGNNQIIHYEKLPLITAIEQPYPYKLENAIISALKNTNINNMEEQINFFFEAIKLYQLDQIMLCMLQLNSSVQRYEYTNNLELTPLDFDLIFIESKTMEDIITLFKNHCTEIITSLTEIKNNKSENRNLVTAVNAMVEENLQNPNLSVAYLASEVHLSINYLRNIYKDNTGESLSDYIIKRKLDIICGLLKNTGLSIQDISDQLGFTTKNYFFTFFKKHMEMTPNQYRREH